MGTADVSFAIKKKTLYRANSIFYLVHSSTSDEILLFGPLIVSLLFK